jgi:hypothetical protein
MASWFCQGEGDAKHGTRGRLLARDLQLTPIGVGL